MRYRKCEICGLRSTRNDKEKRVFIAQFPLDEARCRQWVKVTGNEDLAYIPIEKLHALKFVCGKHFGDRDFKKKKTQLKKTAVPSLGLTRKPLSEELLVDFPCYLYKGHCAPKKGIQQTKISNKSEPENEEYVDKAQPADGAVQPTGAVLKRKLLPVDDVFKYIQSVGPIHHNDTSDNIEEEFYDEDMPTETTFSWQKDSTPVACDTLTEVTKKDLVKQSDEADKRHMHPKSGANPAGLQGKEAMVPVIGDLKQGYKCNLCGGAVDGFLYTCVQCANYDLCASCEARGYHPNHYVLRVPGGRPYSEVLSVLQTLRRALMNDSVVQMESDTVDELKVEVKEEPLDPIYVEPILSPDTALLPALKEEEVDELEEDVEMLEEYLETEASLSPHSHRSESPEPLPPETVADPRTSGTVPGTTGQLFLVAGLDDRRQLDVRLTKEGTSSEVSSRLQTSAANVIGLSQSIKPIAFGHSRRLVAAKATLQPRCVPGTAQATPISHRGRHPVVRLSSPWPSVLPRKMAPVQVYSYRPHSEGAPAGASGEDLENSSRTGRSLAISIDHGRKFSNVVRRGKAVREAHAVVPRVVLEDIRAARKS